MSHSIQPANPECADFAAELIYQTDPAVWDYLFTQRTVFNRFVDAAWRSPSNTYAYTEASLLMREDTPVGLELGYPGSAELDYRKRMLKVTTPALPASVLSSVVAQAQDIDYLTPYIPNDGYYLHFLSVDTRHQGAGYGKQLLMHAVERALQMNCTSMHLDVYVDNPAVGLYLANGFRIVVETNFPEKTGLPRHYRMIKALT